MSAAEDRPDTLFGPATEDPLELLLPEGGERREIARRWSTALRLVRSAGRNDQSQSAGVNPEEALRVLEGRGRDSDQAAMELLLGLHLDACLGPDSWHAWRPESGTAAEAWARLGEGRAVAPPVPEPGESAVQVARRLLDLAEAGGMDPASLGLWEARLAIVQGDLAGARLQLGKCSLPGAATDLAALELQRGAVRAARECLCACATPDGRGLFLAAACGVLLGEPGAERPLRQVRRGGGALPAALAELGAVHGPARLAGELRAGQARADMATTVAEHGLERGHLGASVLVLVALERGGPQGLRRRVRVRSLAAGLEGAQADWEIGRAQAWERTGEAEQELLTGAACVRRHRLSQDGALRGALDPEALALVLVPVLDEQAEPVGWLHLEFAHHLVPSRERLERLARACQSRCLQAQQESVEVPAPVGAWGAGPTGGALGQVFEQLVEELGMKTTRRRWFGFALEPGGPRLVASAGRFGGLGEPCGPHAGGGRALQRAQLTGACVRWSSANPALSVDARSASGVVFPLRLGTETVALFALESTIQRDLREADIERIEAKLQEHRTALVGARFRTRHLEHYGWQPHLPTGVGDFALFVERMRLLAPRRAAMVLVGGAGVGKSVFARWAHELAHTAERDVGGLRPWSAARPLLAAARGPGQSLWIHAPERLGAADQEWLVEQLASAGSAQPKLLVTTECDPRTPHAELSRPLARALCRVVLCIPPLADRRAELPGWIDALSARIAADEGLAVPRWSDEARALLWRQPWECNLRDLDVVLHGLLLESRGDLLEREAVHAALRAAGLEVLSRLPSRQPRQHDVLAALATTRTSSGRVNKTRAALYLGWDPDTLVTRSAELGIDLASPDRPAAWAQAQTPP